ncbi:MAG: tail fiber domain-containing protein [Ignavibacteriae bacterium]|nr:tail fiber domain-containing protein [Ignavibacteriota bacterium]MCB9205882.1 tail fiber domain-containing protein [Ignavibacteriales bacterium]MCB9210728.1 tail fiber domain-containing protein [Ignavibacteriales bacterium]MCB9219235.1 tail fiber domain-containing protein [Ignavibacteriales bacterium]MCB9260128.1 tail fiber domain-containing protein [Ignavibacteriales bacterium]
MKTNKFFFILVSFCIFTFAFSPLQAQEVAKNNGKTLQTSNIEKPNETQIVEGDVIFSDGTNQLIRITDEGTSGAIQFTNGEPDNKTNKLYRKGDSLYFGNTNLSGGGVTEIDDLSDAKFDAYNNLFLGKDAGPVNTNFGLNVGVGLSSLNHLTTGERNTALGSYSLDENTTGNFNVGIGYQASNQNTTGNNNITIGYSTNAFNIGGSNNTIIGHEAGQGGTGVTIHSKNGSVFLGYRSGFFETSSNKLYIENSDTNKPLIWGDFSTDSLQINGNLHVTGNITSDNSVLGATNLNELSDAKTDATSVFLGEGTGNLDDGSNNQNTAIGIEAMNVNSSGGYNTALGYNSLNRNQTGNNNISLGVETMYNNINGHDNIAIGIASLFANVAGHSNVSIGSSSLYSNSGNRNTAVGFEAAGNNIANGSTALGYSAMHYNTDGEGNTAIGYNALLTNTQGDYNTALGYEALTSLPLGNFNTAIGYKTLNSGSFVANNTAVGYNALNQSNGEQNTAVGSKALETNGGGHNSAFGSSSLLSTTGSYNSAFGSGTFVAIDGDSNSALGYDAGKVLSGNQNIAIGSGSMEHAIGDFNIGIGNTSGNWFTGSKNIYIGHEAGYHGIGTFNQSGCVFIGYQAGKNELTNNKLFIENSNSDSPLIWGNFNTDRVVINGNGTNGNPNYNFFVNGDAGGNTAWNNLSDERLKKNISTIPNALEKVKSLRGVNYEWKNSENHDKGLQMGFIAQEANKVIPEVVDDSGEYYSMQYAPITALLVEALKEQQKMIDEIKKNNDLLSKLNSELRNQNAEVNNNNIKLSKDIEQITNILNQVIDKKNEIKFTSN